MNIKVFQNRKIEKDYFYNEGTQNENKSTVLTFEIPLGYEDFSKRIVFITEDGNFWDYIPENEYKIENNITKYGTVEAYLWLTKDEQDFRSQKFELNFYENENADDMTPSEEQVDGFNTLIAELELKIEEVDDLKKETLQALEDLKNQQIDYERRFEEMNNMIKEIQETNEYQSEIIDQFKNEFKQITVSGDSIYIPDAAELPMELIPYGEPVQEVIPEELGTTVEGESVVVADGNPEKEVKDVIYGMSKQETTEGYNIFNLNNYGTRTIKGVTVTQNKDDSLDANGVGAGNYMTFLNNIVITDELEDGETYTLWSNQPNSLLYAQIAVTPLEGSVIHITTGTGIPTFKVNKTTNKSYSIRLQSGANSKDITYNLSNLKFMLVKGSYTIDTIPPYEPYTGRQASPNTEYEQDIEVITECSLVQRGKNLLPRDFTNINETQNVEVSQGEYTFYFNAQNKVGDMGINILGVYEGDTTETKLFDNHTANWSEPNIGYNAVVLSLSKKLTKIKLNGYGFGKIGSCMLVKGALVDEKKYNIVPITDYEPYIEPIVHSIDLAGESIAKVNDVDDKLKIYTNGNVELPKNVVETILDSNWNWVINATTDTYVEFTYTGLNPKAVAGYKNAITNYFSNKVDNRAITNNVQILIRVPISSNIATLEQWKEFLTLNEVKVLYEREETKVIELPSIEPITLFEGTNVFELETNLGTTMALTYDYVTPSPSIDRPSEILTVSGGYDTEKQNKNIIQNVAYYTTKNMYSPTVIADYTVKKGKYYIVSCDTENTGQYIYINAIEDSYGIKRLSDYNKPCDGRRHYWIVKAVKDLHRRANLINKAQYQNNAEVATGYTYNVMMEEILATTDAEALKMLPSEYQEPNNTNLPLTLTKELLGEIVTLTEEEAKQLNLDGAGKYRRTDYGRYVFTGYEAFSLSSYSTNKRICAYLNILTTLVPGKIQCNMIKKGNYVDNLTDELITTTSNSFNIAVFTSRLTDNSIDGLKKFLKSLYDAGTPMETIYKLATPTYEKITDETELEQLSAYDKQIAFYGINNINTYPTDVLVKAPLKIHATYSKSNKLTIQSLEDRLASLESQVTNLQDNQI